MVGRAIFDSIVINSKVVSTAIERQATNIPLAVKLRPKTKANERIPFERYSYSKSTKQTSVLRFNAVTVSYPEKNTTFSR
jgi:hypothetical protein